ncbi:type I-E CRISPR-associated protein Cse2/CasB [Yinghuangia sp. ASG 101]|uniref:type I-E CRISPR-associated protein Cse2/CasB n=1 Tax=Yinghuangia sp. ASG 101 TaxID=2896848 RepID=UPI001E428324|nr:type I-E CRISPR-associated protein Cse2/CasB [Yinghuangia sp. ASG 101]UGQ10910.1 type I-E CRISPR-associated protein Cse2/CasB [Yinghuangia sp. ASG 101]
MAVLCVPHERCLGPAPGLISAEQKAEHAALALYGLHQQSQKNPMHKPGVSVGAALRTLRGSGEYSEAALDRRVNAAATATSTAALLKRLRGLVTQLRGEGIGWDYDLLLRDLVAFDHPARRSSVRRGWGAAYYGWRGTPADAA